MSRHSAVNKDSIDNQDAKVGDVILILDKELVKGKFTTGVIESVKVDPDNVVRTVTMKYKLKQKIPKTPEDVKKYTPTVTKYVERNVRELTLLVTAEKRQEIENIDLDYLKFKFSKKPSNQNHEDDDEATEGENNENSLKSPPVDQSGGAVSEENNSEVENVEENDLNSEEENEVDVEKDDSEKTRRNLKELLRKKMKERNENSVIKKSFSNFIPKMKKKFQGRLGVSRVFLRSQ